MKRKRFTKKDWKKLEERNRKLWEKVEDLAQFVVKENLPLHQVVNRLTDTVETIEKGNFVKFEK